MNFIVLLTLALLIHVSHAQTSPEDFLAPHNAARAEVSVAPLVWDEAVATYARNYANQRAGDCTLLLSGGQYSENLALVSGSLSAADVVQLWYDQKSNYDYPSNTCPGETEKCLQYVNVVCRKSLYLGCAAAPCNNGNFIVACNYDPPCILGERPF